MTSLHKKHVTKCPVQRVCYRSKGLSSSISPTRRQWRWSPCIWEPVYSFSFDRSFVLTEHKHQQMSVSATNKRLLWSLIKWCVVRKLFCVAKKILSSLNANIAFLYSGNNTFECRLDYKKTDNLLIINNLRIVAKLYDASYSYNPIKLYATHSCFNMTTLD